MLCLMILLCPLIASSQQAEKNTIRTINKRGLEIVRFEAYVQHEMDSLKVPGLSIAVINDGDIVYSAELGVKNLATREPVDRHTLFEAASLSKPVFAHFTLLLAGRGVLNIDTPIYRYYMDKEVDFSDERYKLLTARMVLNHASGWPNWRQSPQDRLIFGFKPGTRLGYSGEGTIICLRSTSSDTFVFLRDILETGLTWCLKSVIT